MPSQTDYTTTSLFCCSWLQSSQNYALAAATQHTPLLGTGVLRPCTIQVAPVQRTRTHPISKNHAAFRPNTRVVQPPHHQGGPSLLLQQYHEPTLCPSPPCAKPTIMSPPCAHEPTLCPSLDAHAAMPGYAEHSEQLMIQLLQAHDTDSAPSIMEKSRCVAWQRPTNHQSSTARRLMHMSAHPNKNITSGPAQSRTRDAWQGTHIQTIKDLHCLHMLNTLIMAKLEMHARADT